MIPAVLGQVAFSYEAVSGQHQAAFVHLHRICLRISEVPLIMHSGVTKEQFRWFASKAQDSS